MSKKELRRAIRLALRSMTPQEIKDQSLRATKVLETLPEWKSSHKVALYLHMDKELETTEMIDAAFKAHKRVFLPRIADIDDEKIKSFERQTTHLEMLEVTSPQQVSELKPQGKYQIREPNSGTNCFDVNGVDLIVVPAMAFTENCNRMGHGAGYYDSFIEEHITQTTKIPKLIGVGLRQQLVEKIPLEPHDRQMDAVIIDDKLYVQS